MKETMEELINKVTNIYNCENNTIQTEILTRFAAQEKKIGELQKEVEKWKALPKRCICGHYHCPICGNQTVLDVNLEAEVDRLNEAVSKSGLHYCQVHRTIHAYINGKFPCCEIDRLTAELEDRKRLCKTLSDSHNNILIELAAEKERGKKAVEAMNRMYSCKYEPDKIMLIYRGYKQANPEVDDEKK
jgi:hypothetical protein